MKSLCGIVLAISLMSCGTADACRLFPRLGWRLRTRPVIRRVVRRPVVIIQRTVIRRSCVGGRCSLR